MKLTLNKIRAHSPCGMDPRAVPLTGFCKLRSYLGDGFDPDQEFSLVAVLDSNGLDHAHWCLRVIEGYDKEIKRYVIDTARDVQHLMSQESIEMLDIAERYIEGQASAAELEVAMAAAADGDDDSATFDADAAAMDAADAAYADAADSEVFMARASAYAAEWAAAAAGDAAAGWDYAAGAVWAAAAGLGLRAKQEDRLRKLCAAI